MTTIKVTKLELIDRLATEAGLTKKDAAEFLDALKQVVLESLSEGHEVSLAGGVLYPRHMQSRKGVNPATLEPMQIPAKVGVGFRAGEQLKNAVSHLNS